MVLMAQLSAQTSPHGAGFAMDCAKCHSPESWSFSGKAQFSHDSTGFALTGQHRDLECKSCHTSLEFKKIDNACISCHTDVHQQTVGNDCARCHTSDSWLVDNVTQLHEKTSFPLMGVHATVNCNACHDNETNLRFAPTGVDCISCHRADYVATQQPDHVKFGFSTDCASCHSLTVSDWNTNKVDHSFFPLEKGHAIDDCAKCHQGGDYSSAMADCFSCHENDYMATINPNHSVLAFGTDCRQCHDLTPGWKPVDYREHDAKFFPIYSGKHQGTWESCASCHTDPNNYASFSCVICHKDPETSNLHQLVSGYTYQDNACLACHPTGDADMAFNHDATQFPLTGAHKILDCIACHANGYAGTPIECKSCHLENFTSTSDPDHQALHISEDCKACHTTEPGWAPARFDVHDDYYPLLGAHAAVANDCALCHNGSYNNTPNNCAGCHIDDYNTTTDPNHKLSQISQDCASCHGQAAWQPSTFNHDGMYFPIYSGKHNGVWMQCTECHKNPSNYAEFTCVSCHQNPETNDVHTGVSGYNYNDNACLACHPTGDADNAFDHNNTQFPLTGAHVNVDCISCHAAGFEGTSTLCVDCHQLDFNGTTNPNHTGLGFATDCKQCHTTDPGWAPASMPNHNDYYVLNGAHAGIANDCATCHNGNYNTTPNTCAGCHQADYDATTDPNHFQAHFPNDCASCHNESAWQPATFNHDGQYFPIYSGKHQATWTQCTECHTNPANYTEFTCVTCHQNPETNDQHNGIPGYIYQSTACLACHPTGDADLVFDHNTTQFPLTGAHTTIDCISCHANGFQGTSTACMDCHLTDFNSAVNPNHVALGIPTDCAQCHTTAPGWSPASFAIHNQYYPLNGAHAAIANDCAACHNGNYNNTPNTCAACHNDDYVATTNPNHVAAQFPNDCASCHSEQNWVPSTFNHDGQYFPIYSGSHNGQWTQCVDCHSNPANYAQVVCITCHQNPETNDQHQTVGGYVYTNAACLACHPTGEANGMSFNHNTTAFPLTGGHIGVDCIQCHANGYQGTSTACVDCHMDNFTASIEPNHVALNVPTDCAMCHTTTPGWAPATFPIHNQYYALNGAHAAIANDCAQCHSTGYNNTPNTCNGCHNANYLATTNPNHVTAQFPTDCASCHNENVWMPANFDHDGLYFPIYSGSHNGQWTQCIDCHNNPANYAQVVCITCHQNPETNDEHLTVGGYVYTNAACLACHPTGEANGMTFNHNTTAFPLTGGHVGVDCIQCHASGYQGTTTVCMDCHMDNFTASAEPNHVALNMPTDCAMCHTTTPGWAPATFPIHDNYYALTGAHAAIANDCAQCHSSGYSNTPNDCNGCHNANFTAAVNPNHVALGLSTDCASCHTTAPGWAPATFAVHDDYYPLNGAHAAIANDCAECHNGNYTNTPNTCNGCHNSEYQATTNPNHVTANFPTDCAACHNENNWTPATFNHDGLYFPIYSGEHQGEWTSCTDCHTNPNNYAVFTCLTCHTNPETNDEHEDVGGYVYNSPACLACHPQGEASPSSFNHNATAFPITGAHQGLSCVECHSAGYQGTSTACVSCHNTEFQGAAEPNHVALNFPTDCAMCHNTSAGWAPATFPIHSNYYELTGAHASIANDCALCHSAGYSNTPNTCNGCHNDNYTAAVNPNHVALGLSTDCASCHTTAPGWAPATFAVHDNYYPLTGAHASIATDCGQCHAGGNYNNTPNTCNGCHNANYIAAANPNHVALGLSTDCASCHSTVPGWAPATFAVHNTYYPLTGAHEAIATDCEQCHAGGNYSNTPNTCNGCHNANYVTAANPNHVALGLSTDCTSCHTTAPGWSPATFAIHNTYYPLTGAHAAIATDCEQCHAGGNYSNTPNTCNGCHNANYVAAANPNHVALGLSTNCASCHTTAPGWSPATFAVHNTYYPLTGAHAAIANDCEECHAGGNYNNTPNTCNGCHNANYVAASNPNHVALGLSTNCASCHTTAPGWSPATFAVHNTYYPLTGAHAAIASDCEECHAGGNYNNTPSTCNGCHNANYIAAANPNHVALGLSTDCASCHTTAPGWSPATFAVHNNYYPLIGAHASIASDCSQCHTGGNYSNTPNTCFGCHASEYNTANSPNHISAGFPTDCVICHGQSNWTPSTWDHDDLYFPIFSGEHEGEWDDCSDCHTNPNNYNVFTCFTCHSQSSTNGDHNGVSGYQYNSNACYNCHPNGEE